MQLWFVTNASKYASLHMLSLFEETWIIIFIVCDPCKRKHRHVLRTLKGDRNGPTLHIRATAVGDLAT